MGERDSRRENLHAALDAMLDKIEETPDAPVMDAVLDYLIPYLERYGKAEVNR